MPDRLLINYRVASDARSLAALAAHHWVEESCRAVAAWGRARLAISGGSTPRAAFEMLADPHLPWCSRMPWEKIELYWVDERAVPPEDAASNFRMTREALLDRVALDPARIHRIFGELAPEEAAARYEADLRSSFGLADGEWPVFDLVALGMGGDGHTASLFPHTAALNENSRLAVANFVPQQPLSWRITLTLPVLNRARSLFFLIGGADKAAVASEVFTGPAEPARLPSQLIWPESGELTLLLDQPAAAKLQPANSRGEGHLERRH